MDILTFKQIIDHIEKDREGDGYWLEVLLSNGARLHGSWETVATALWFDRKTMCPSVIVVNGFDEVDRFVSVEAIVTVGCVEIEAEV